VPGGAAEVRVTVVPQLEQRPPAGRVLRVAGRLMGPRCAGRSTVEIAYPFTPLPAGGTDLTARAVIPEPGLWGVESPFLYSGPVELWDRDVKAVSANVSLGLREFRVGSRGLRCNADLLPLTGAVFAGSPAAFKAEGFNLAVVPAGEATEGLWHRAASIGLLVAYRWEEGSFARRLTLALAQQPCGLAGLVPAGQIGSPAVAELRETLAARGTPLFLGAEVSSSAETPAGEGVDFVVCPAGLLPALGGVALPKLVWGEPPADAPGLILGTLARGRHV
jgi:hypothetical protein